MNPWLLFDFDGTIANSIQKLYELVNGLAPKYGYTPISPERFNQLRDLPLTKVCRALKIPVFKLGQMIPIILKEYENIIPGMELCPGILPMLAKLKESEFNLALISSNHTENVQAFLDNHNIACFDWVEGTSGIMQKQRNIKRQIHKHKLDHAKVLYVGDETRDIKAARKSGVQIIAVTWGLHSEKYLRSFKPDFLVNDPLDIIDIARSVRGIS